MQKQYLLVGYPFSGKTTLAKAIESKVGFTRINIDEVKFVLGYEGVSDDDISEDEWKRIFAELDRQIVTCLSTGKTIITEYAWVKKAWRDKARKLADDFGIETKVIYVNTPERIARERWLKNRKTYERFDVTDSVFEEAVREFEVPTPDEHVITFSMNEDIDEWIKKNF